MPRDINFTHKDCDGEVICRQLCYGYSPVEDVLHGQAISGEPFETVVEESWFYCNDCESTVAFEDVVDLRSKRNE